MPKSPQRTKSRAPFAWAPLLHFANARLTEANWQAVLLKPYGIKPMPGVAVFGFTSLEQVGPVLADSGESSGSS